MDVVKDQADEVFYDKLDSAYPTDDEEEAEVSVLYIISFSGTANRLLNKNLLTSNIIPFPLLQEEGDEASLETYYSEDEVDDDSDRSTCNLHSEVNFARDFQNPESETKSEVPEADGYAVANSLSNEADGIDQEDSSSSSVNQGKGQQYQLARQRAG